MTNAPHEIAPGHTPRATVVDGHTFAAVASPKGYRERITLYRDTEEYDTRTTTRVGQYGFIILVQYDSTERGRVAPFYAGQPKHVGQRHERGLVVGCVAIQRVARTPAMPEVDALAAEVEAAAPSLQEGREAARLQALGQQADRLAIAAETARRAQLELDGAVCEAARLGMSHRAIAKSAGITHPTVAKILRRYGVASAR